MGIEENGQLDQYAEHKQQKNIGGVLLFKYSDHR
jgi:hypothetical protein